MFGPSPYLTAFRCPLKDNRWVLSIPPNYSSDPLALTLSGKDAICLKFTGEGTATLSHTTKIKPFTIYELKPAKATLLQVITL